MPGVGTSPLEFAQLGDVLHMLTLERATSLNRQVARPLRYHHRQTDASSIVGPFTGAGDALNLCGLAARPGRVASEHGEHVDARQSEMMSEIDVRLLEALRWTTL
jgi:hypothetical protein